MANAFKNAIKENVSHDSANPDSVLTSPTGNASRCVVIGLQLTNTSSSEITATVGVCDYSGNSNNTGNIIILNAVPIPANSMLSVLQGDKLLLEEQDILKIYANTSSALNAFVNYLLIDNT